MDQCLEDTEPIRYGELNVIFHEIIWEMADNDYVRNLIVQLHAERAHYDNLRNVVFDKKNLLESIHEHKTCVAAIIDGDQETARKIMEQHVLRSRRKFLKALLKLGE
jgi:DNA-binding GntR family transcriptional regulator